MRANAKSRQRTKHCLDMDRSKAAPWFRVFPAGTELQRTEGGLKNDRALVVDVENESSHDLVAFRDAFPELKQTCILEDTLRSSAAIGMGRFEEGEPMPGRRVQVLAYDQIVSRSSQGARIYLVHGILHHYREDDVVEVLRDIANAMDANYSRVLIVEKALLVSSTGSAFKAIRAPKNGDGSETLEQAGAPWISLLEQARLETVWVWENEGNFGIVIEAMVKPTEWF